MAKRLTIKNEDGSYSINASVMTNIIRTLINRLGEYEDLYPDIDALKELSKCKGIYKEED